jgi:hypothetical protein
MTTRPMKALGRFLLVTLAIAVSAAAAFNVLGDDAAVRADAEAIACPRGCTGATSVKIDRSPLAETVEYLTPHGSIVVRCQRAAVLVGPYFCAKE